jgi:hypothetical protein
MNYSGDLKVGTVTIQGAWLTPSHDTVWVEDAHKWPQEAAVERGRFGHEPTEKLNE